jgi:hypothetical protein
LLSVSGNLLLSEVLLRDRGSVLLTVFPVSGITSLYMILLFLSLPVAVGVGIFWVKLALEFTIEDVGIIPPEAAEISNWNTSVHIPEFQIGPENQCIKIRVRHHGQTTKEYH